MLIPAMVLLAPAVRPAHEYDLLNVKLDLTLDYKTESIAGVVENTLKTTKANATLAFDKGPMTVSSVTVVPNAPITTKTTKDHIFVTLKKAAKGTQYTVRIQYRAEPEAGIYFVPQSRAFPALCDVAYTQGEMEDTRYWIPTYDFPDDKATTETIVRVPKEFSVLSNGKLVSSKIVGNQAVWNWKQDKPMATYLMSVVAGRYTKIPDGQFKNIPVEIWAPAGTEGMAKAAFGGTDQMVTLYSKLTGIDYPWAKYAQSMVPEFMFGGMENLSCTTQTIGAIFPENSKGVESADGLNAHELAHQWFGDLITCRDWSHIWVNEGWATFMPHFVTRERKGEDAFHIERLGTQAGAYYGAMSHPMVRNDYTVPMEMFDNNAYPGGATRMFMLYHELGETLFWKCCNRYLQEYGYKNVTTEQFFESWSKTSGRNLDAFRKQWFYNKAWPRFVVERTGDQFKISQTNKDFKVIVDYALYDGEMLRRKGRLDFTEASEISLEAPNQILVVDPGAWMLGDIEYRTNYTTDQWKIAYQNAENAAGKVRILPRLREDQTFLKSEFARTSEALKASVIGYITETDFLIAKTMDSNPVIARNALSLLNGRKGDKVVNRVTQILNSTPNESLKNTAFGVLLSIKDDEPTAMMGWNMQTYNLGTQTMALNWLAGKNPDKARELALRSVREFAPGPVRMSAISVLGRVKDKAGSREVFDLLVQLAKGRPYAPMDAAINALATYGDKAAIPVIRSRENHSLHFGRNTVQSALARLNRK
jgi:aminopeptidase N